MAKEGTYTMPLPIPTQRPCESMIYTDSQQVTVLQGHCVTHLIIFGRQA